MKHIQCFGKVLQLQENQAFLKRFQLVIDCLLPISGLILIHKCHIKNLERLTPNTEALTLIE